MTIKSHLVVTFLFDRIKVFPPKNFILLLLFYGFVSVGHRNVYVGVHLPHSRSRHKHRHKRRHGSRRGHHGNSHGNGHGHHGYGIEGDQDEERDYEAMTTDGGVGGSGYYSHETFEAPKYHKSLSLPACHRFIHPTDSIEPSASTYS